MIHYYLLKIVSYLQKSVFNLFLAFAVYAFLMGIHLPLMELEKFWFFTNQFSLLSSLEVLWNKQEHLIAIVLLLFSIITPIIKFVFLGITANFSVGVRNKGKNILLVLETWGKWSMLDVFVVALLFVAIKLDALANVTVHQGLYWFAAAVLIQQILSTWLYVFQKKKISA